MTFRRWFNSTHYDLSACSLMELRRRAFGCNSQSSARKIRVQFPAGRLLCLWPNGEGTRLILRSVRELYVTSLRIRATPGSSPGRHIGLDGQGLGT